MSHFSTLRTKITELPCVTWVSRLKLKLMFVATTASVFVATS